MCCCLMAQEALQLASYESHDLNAHVQKSLNETVFLVTPLNVKDTDHVEETVMPPRKVFSL